MANRRALFFKFVSHCIPLNAAPGAPAQTAFVTLGRFVLCGKQAWCRYDMCAAPSRFAFVLRWTLSRPRSVPLSHCSLSWNGNRTAVKSDKCWTSLLHKSDWLIVQCTLEMHYKIANATPHFEYADQPAKHLFDVRCQGPSLSESLGRCNIFASRHTMMAREKMTKRYRIILFR
eukprot:IDg8855t1